MGLVGKKKSHSINEGKKCVAKTNINQKTLDERNNFLEQFKDLPVKELLIKCKDDPAIFARYMLGVDLYGWQWLVTRQIVAGEKKVILNTSRQIGKSFLVSVVSLWYQIFNLGKSSKFFNTKVGVISASENQAKKLLLDIKNLMRVGDMHCKEEYDIPHLFSSMIDTTQGAENTKTCITFLPWEKKFGVFLDGAKVGGFIKSMPPTESVRGETFDFLIVDEAAQIDDEIYNSTISKTGDKYDAVRFITSTPFGRKGFFYEYFDPEMKLKSNKWNRFWFTVDCLSLDDEEDYKRRLDDIEFQIEAGKNLTVRQEYYGDFVQSDQSFFNPQKCDEMIEDYTQLESFRGECDLGIDFGGLRKSRTVITITAISKDDERTVRRLYHHMYQVREDASLIDDISELKKRFNVQRIIVDYCPEGDFKIREMEELGWDVTYMQFATDKVRKFGDFRTMLNRGLIKSYPDSDLLGEMKALSVAKGRERTKIQPPPGYNDDVIDSFVIASYHQTQQDDDFEFFDLDEVEDNE